MPSMVAPPSKNIGTIRRLAALTLVFWLAGLGCLMGCEINAATDEAQEASASAESCASNAGHDCCHQAKNDNASPFVSTLPIKTAQISCCLLAVQSSNPARKVNHLDAPLTVAGNKLLTVPDARMTVVLPAYRLQVPDRGSTYLRCCVFLI